MIISIPIRLIPSYKFGTGQNLSSESGPGLAEKFVLIWLSWNRLQVTTASTLADLL